MDRPHITEEIDNMTDLEFLTKIKLIINGKITNTAMILLGNPDYDYVFQTPPKIMWRLYGSDNEIKDYEIFTIPFINIVDKVFLKIRNLTYRYIPNQLSLFPKETQQYDTWLLRELLNNCIVHSNYQLGGRIYVNEFENRIEFTNPGDFIPKTIEVVLKPNYNPPFYRNQLLADSMVKFYMIDTATSGIKKVYRIQKTKFFPMPDYDFSTDNQVMVSIYGKTIDEKYTYILFNFPKLDLETVYLLDQVQKKQGKKLSKDAIKYLRKHNLVEGRIQNLYLSSKVAETIKEESQYIKNKAFDNKYYKDLVINYLKEFNKAQRKDINILLWSKLPDNLTDEQKSTKISNLLTSLRKNNLITTNSSNQQKAYWILVK